MADDDNKPLTWPIGDCKTFDEFAAKYRNPDGSWQDTPWLNERGWHNDRFVETFINDTRRDFEGERLPLEAQIRAMPFFMENGRYEWYHGTKTGGTPVPLGKPVAWRIRDGMIESRFGVFSSADTGHPFSDEKWKTIQKWGTRGTSSVVFAPIGPKYLRREGPFTTLDIPGAWLFDVGFVGPMGASPGSTNNFVSDAKGLVQMKAYLHAPDETERRAYEVGMDVVLTDNAGLPGGTGVIQGMYERPPPEKAPTPSRLYKVRMEDGTERVVDEYALAVPVGEKAVEPSDWKSFFEKRQCPYCHKTVHGQAKLQEHIAEMQAEGAPSHMESFLRSDAWNGLFESKPGPGHEHSAKFERCLEHAKENAPSGRDPDEFAHRVCYTSVGKEMGLKATAELALKCPHCREILGGETFKTDDRDSLDRAKIDEGMGMDINLAEFIAAHNITKLKAETMANPVVCPPCAARVEARIAQGLTRELATAELQKTLDELIADVQEKKKKDAKWKALAEGVTETPEQKAAREKAEAEAAKKGGEKGTETGGKAGDQECPKGYHKDPDSGECVADNPKVTEEGMKALQDEIAGLRNTVGRLIQGQMTGEATKSAKALKTSIAGMSDIPDDIRTKVLDEVDRVYPTDVQAMLKEFESETLGAAKEAADKAVRSVLEPVTDSIAEIRKKMKMPSREPRGTVDKRGANILASASNDHEALATLDRTLAKMKGGAS